MTLMTKTYAKKRARRKERKPAQVLVVSGCYFALRVAGAENISNSLKKFLTMLIFFLNLIILV